MKRCPNCGRQMETDFCGNCGTDLRSVLPEEKGISIDVDLDDIKPSSDHDGAIDIGDQSGNKNTKNKDDEILAATDEVIQAKDEFVKMAGHLAGSLGRLATKKGEEVIGRLDEEVKNISTSSQKKDRNVASKSLPKKGETKKLINGEDPNGPKKSNKTTGIIALSLVALLCLSMMITHGGGGSSSQDNSAKTATEEAKESYNLHIEVQYEENIFFSKYEAEVYVDDEYLGPIAQGEVFTDDIVLKEGEHTIKFQKSGDSMIDGTTDVELDSDMVFSCTIGAHSDEIEITGRRIETKEEYQARIDEEKAAALEKEEKEKEEAEAEKKKAKEEKKAKAEKEAKDEEEKANSDEYTYYDLATIEDELDSNAAAAKKKYLHQKVEVTGVIDNIDADGDYINLRDPYNEWDFVGIQCFVKSKNQEKQLMDLSKGDTVTLGGEITIVGEVLGLGLNIDYIK